MITYCGIRMYSLKQSLTQRPILWINHRGQPTAATVDAAPILNECDDMLSDVVLSFSALLIPDIGGTSHFYM